MTEKIGPYDYTKLHVLGENPVRAFERRVRLIVTDSTGKPRRVLPDGIDYMRWGDFMRDGDRIVRGYVLVEVGMES